MKRLLFFIFLFLLIPSNSVFAAEETTIQAASFVPTKVIFDGYELYLRHDPLVGIVRENESNVRNYMPLKGVLEQIGYIVNFDDARNQITVITPGSVPPPHVPSTSATSRFAGPIRAAAYNDYTLVINGATMDFTDENFANDRIISVLRGTEAHPTFFMPVRPVLEYLGYYVGWDSEQNAVIIASESYFNSYGTLKAVPIPSEEPEEEEGVIEAEETLDDAETAIEPLPSPDMSPEEVTVFNLDESVANAITVLTENLQDPSSLAFHEIRYTGDENTGFAIYIDFSSKNALGGFVRRIAEINIDGTLIVEGETQVEGAADNTLFYTAIRMAFQRALPYAEY